MDNIKSYEAKEWAKKITLYVGLIFMFAGGICYLLISDLAYGNLSTWLISASILSIGSAGCFFFSTNMKDFPKKQLILRSIGLALGIGFVVYLHVSTGSEFYQSVSFDKVSGRNASTVVSLILAYIGVVGQAANIALICVFKDE